MIEIAFDENAGGTYQKKTYPLLEVPNLKNSSINTYVRFAASVIASYPNTPFVIFKQNDNNFCVQKLAFAMFIASSLNETLLGCAVFKVQNQKETYENYKPYIAASIGIKYALRLRELSYKEVYKELMCLNYLRFEVIPNNKNNSVLFKMASKLKKNPVKITTKTVFDALIYVSTLKALSLANIDAAIEIEVFISNTAEKIAPKRLIGAITKELSKYINI